ncbi:MAG: LPXTG cell wall anchor domain-containing protein [Limosilactobacillus pontis]
MPQTGDGSAYVLASLGLLSALFSTLFLYRRHN